MNLKKIEDEFYNKNMTQSELCNFANQYLPILFLKVANLEKENKEMEKFILTTLNNPNEKIKLPQPIINKLAETSVKLMREIYCKKDEGGDLNE